MNDTSLLEHLEEVAARLGVELRYEHLGTHGIRCDGGYCRVAGKPLILLNSRDSKRRKILVLARSLRKLDLEGIFIAPGIRRIIESQSA